jgi:hypothetical protein
MDHQSEVASPTAGQPKAVNPGYLLKPLGWTGKSVPAMLQADPDLGWDEMYDDAAVCDAELHPFGEVGRSWV